jgi:hypothetical protein
MPKSPVGPANVILKIARILWLALFCATSTLAFAQQDAAPQKSDD